MVNNGGKSFDSQRTAFQTSSQPLPSQSDIRLSVIANVGRVEKPSLV